MRTVKATFTKTWDFSESIDSLEAEQGRMSVEDIRETVVEDVRDTLGGISYGDVCAHTTVTINPDEEPAWKDKAAEFRTSFGDTFGTEDPLGGPDPIDIVDWIEDEPDKHAATMWVMDAVLGAGEFVMAELIAEERGRR